MQTRNENVKNYYENGKRILYAEVYQTYSRSDDMISKANLEKEAGELQAMREDLVAQYANESTVSGRERIMMKLETVDRRIESKNAQIVLYEEYLAGYDAGETGETNEEG